MFSAIVKKADFEDIFGSDWNKRNFPFRCYYSEIEIPEKVFDYS